MSSSTYGIFLEVDDAVCAIDNIRAMMAGGYVPEVTENKVEKALSDAEEKIRSCGVMYEVRSEDEDDDDVGDMLLITEEEFEDIIDDIKVEINDYISPKLSDEFETMVDKEKFETLHDRSMSLEDDDDEEDEEEYEDDDADDDADDDDDDGEDDADEDDDEDNDDDDDGDEEPDVEVKKD